MSFQAEANSTNLVALDASIKDSSIGQDNCDPPRASLLGAPAEIRNRIYELVLVSKYTITAEPDETIEEPGLLQTCRQIRAEASAIYFTQNEFEWQIDECRFSPQSGHWLWREVPSNNLFPYHGPIINWENLLEWLKIHHAGLGPASHKVDQIFNWDDFYLKAWVVKLFEMVDTLRGQSWDMTARLLEQSRQLLESAEETINRQDWSIPLFN